LKLIKITKKIFRVFHETSSNFPHQQLSEMLQKSRPDLRASSKTWDIGSILRFISKSANSELSTTPLPFCAASNGRMPEPGVGVAKWNQNHPVVFFWKKRRQKWKTNMLRYVRILDIFQAPKKNMSLSSFLEEYRDYFTKKKAQKYPIFEVLLVFFLKPLRLDPPVWLRFWTGSFGSGDFFRKTLLVTHCKGGCKLQMVTVLIGLHLPSQCKSTTNVHRKCCALSKIKCLGLVRKVNRSLTCLQVLSKSFSNL